MERVPYDEFSMFQDNAEEFGIPYAGPPTVRREFVEVEPGRKLSVLIWGDGDPELVFLHGGAQNAHTWDTVALALDRPLVALDLPGHGHSDGGIQGSVDVRENAKAVAAAIRVLAPNARAVIGMSLGGLTANALAAGHPDLVRRLVVVDVTPGVDRDKAKEIHDFIAGPQSFASFGEIFDRTVQFNPTRTHSSLRRGILHNAHRMPDGSWEWNYDRRQLTGVEMPAFGDLWEDVAATRCPYLLVRGALSPVVDDGDVAELHRRRPDARVVVMEGAGHSVQGDRPLELAELVRAELEA